jgi:hypothetical protein
MLLKAYNQKVGVSTCFPPSPLPLTNVQLSTADCPMAHQQLHHFDQPHWCYPSQPPCRTERVPAATGSVVWDGHYHYSGRHRSLLLSPQSSSEQHHLRRLCSEAVWFSTAIHMIRNSQSTMLQVRQSVPVCCWQLRGLICQTGLCCSNLKWQRRKQASFSPARRD